MTALVTGGTGFVGGHLIQALRQQGRRVLALARSPDKASQVERQGATALLGDLHHVDPASLRNVQVVYHLAGLTAARSEAEFLHVNAEGTARIMAAAHAAGVGRFVLVSSLAAAGPSPAGGPRDDHETTRPVTDYGRSKAAAEAIVRGGPLPWVIVRPPAVYGPHDVELLKVFKIARLGTVPIFGDGSQALSLVYGPDLATAITAVGQPDAPVSQIYYPAHPEVVSSAGLVRAIGSAMGRRTRLIPLPRIVAKGILTLTEAGARLTGQATLLNRDKLHEFFAPAWTCDPASLTADTGWRAAHDIAAGIPATLAWYRGQGWL